MPLLIASWHLYVIMPSILVVYYSSSMLCNRTRNGHVIDSPLYFCTFWGCLLLEHSSYLQIWTSTLQRTLLTSRHIVGFPKVRFQYLGENSPQAFWNLPWIWVSFIQIFPDVIEESTICRIGISSCYQSLTPNLFKCWRIKFCSWAGAMAGIGWDQLWCLWWYDVLRDQRNYAWRLPVSHSLQYSYILVR